MQAMRRFNYYHSVQTLSSPELFMATHLCIYLNGATNGFSNFTSRLLTVKILCRALDCLGCPDRDLLRGDQAGDDLETVTLTVNHFSVSLRDAPEDKSWPAPREAPRDQRKQRRSHQFRSSLFPQNRGIIYTELTSRLIEIQIAS